MKKRVLSFFLCLALSLSLLPAAAAAQAEQAEPAGEGITEIHSVAVYGVGTPVLGDTPEDTYRFEEYEHELAEQGVAVAVWNVRKGSAKTVIESTEQYAQGDGYRLYLELEPLPGYAFAADCTFTFDNKEDRPTNSSGVNASTGHAAVWGLYGPAQADRPIAHVSIKGCRQIISGYSSEQIMRFDKYADYLTEQHCVLREWYSYNHYNAERMGEKESFVSGRTYSARMVLVPMEGYCFNRNTTFDFDGMTDVDFSAVSSDEGGPYAEVHSKGVKAIDPQTITELTVPGIHAVRAGLTPNQTLRVADFTEQLEKQGLELTSAAMCRNDDGTYLEGSTKYWEGMDFNAEIKFVAKQGYSISSDVRLNLGDEAAVDTEITNRFSNDRQLTIYTEPVDALPAPKTVSSFTLKGFGNILVGNTPAGTFSLESYADELAAKGLAPDSWSVTDVTLNKVVGNDETFKAGHRYSVTVTVKTLEGYVLSGSCAVTADATLTKTQSTLYEVTVCSAPVKAIKQISAITVPGYHSPEAGKTPAELMEFESAEAAAALAAQGVTLQSWDVYVKKGRDTYGASKTAQMEEGKTYTFCVRLVPLEHYVFTENCTADFGNGIAGSPCGLSESGCFFAWTPEERIPVTVTSVSVPGYHPMIVGRTPAETFEFDSEETTAALAEQGVEIKEWYVLIVGPDEDLPKNEPFAADETYAVGVTLIPLDGCVFDEDCTLDFGGAEEIDTRFTHAYPKQGKAYVWGAEVEALRALPAFTVNHSCTLNECLELNYYIPVSALDGYDNIKMTVQYERFDGDTRTLSAEKTLTPTTVTMSGEQRYRFSFKGIAAAEIGSRIYAQVSAVKGGVTYYAAEPDVYSIADYCYAVLASSITANSLKTLCVDTLNYGAAAQTHFNVNPGNLCNAKLTNAQKARSVGKITLTACNSTKAYAGTVKASFGGKSYVLNNAPELKLRIVPNSGVDASKLKVKYTYTRADNTTATGTLTPMKVDGDWVVRLNTVAGPDLRSPITFIICEGSKQVSDTLTFSAEGYCYSMTNSATAAQTLKDLCSAMMRFSEAARRHFG